MFRRLLKILLWMVALPAALLIGFVIYGSLFFRIEPPSVVAEQLPSLEISEPDSGLLMIGNNWFRKSESGLYELYAGGKPYERGVIIGRLTHAQVQYQEQVFHDQIHRLVPSGFYLGVLKHLVGFFNRKLDLYVSDEYQKEIYGISHAASHAYDDIATPYQRLLNYHAAHDIGHALQNMSLVGCTSFATWADRSEDGSLIIGRNFDFYVGEAFARDKIIAFYNPAEGNKFMMVTFGGMTGVVSGMNEAGLTVTLNAAKSEAPFYAATPVSILAREILQYATTIEEAYHIAGKRKTFVAESFLIGSANDKRAVIIEKSPDGLAQFEGDGNYIISTNHFQSELGNTALNREHMRTSASVYRWQRVKELLEENKKNTVPTTATILRDQRGLNNADIGLGNEKLINQLIAHHSVIFQPEKKRVWVSTAPWQLGKYVCYELDKIFSAVPVRNQEVYSIGFTLAADPFVHSRRLTEFVKYSRCRFPFDAQEGFHPDSVIRWNPSSYHSYMLAADHYKKKKLFRRAAELYAEALKYETATVQEREHLQKNLRYCQEKMQ